MVDYKKHLANVAFGGAWSEELVARDALKSVMQVLERAAANCGEQEVRDGALAEALSHVRRKVEKGPMLVEGFQNALLEPLPEVREARVRHYVDMIADWAGY